MKTAGLLLIGICAFIYVRSYVRAREEELSEYRGVYEMLRHIESKISGTGMPFSEAIADFSCECTRINELASVLLTEIGGMGERNLGAVRKLAVGDEDRARLVGYFSQFGREGFDEELRRLSEIRRHFESRERELSARIEKDIKILWTLYATAISALAFLVI